MSDSNFLASFGQEHHDSVADSSYLLGSLDNSMLQSMELPEDIAAMLHQRDQAIGYDPYLDESLNPFLTNQEPQQTNTFGQSQAHTHLQSSQELQQTNAFGQSQAHTHLQSSQVSLSPGHSATNQKSAHLHTQSPQVFQVPSQSATTQVQGHTQSQSIQTLSVSGQPNISNMQGYIHHESPLSGPGQPAFNHMQGSNPTSSLPPGVLYCPKLQFVRSIHAIMDASPDIPEVCKDRYAPFVIQAMITYDEIHPGMNLWEIISQPRMVVYIRSKGVQVPQIPATIGNNPNLPTYVDILNDPASTSLDQQVRVPITHVQPPLDTVMIRLGGEKVMQERYIEWRDIGGRPLSAIDRQNVDPFKQPDRFEFAQCLESFLELAEKNDRNGKAVGTSDAQRAKVLEILQLQKNARKAAKADFRRQTQITQVLQQETQFGVPNTNPLTAQESLPNIPSSIAAQGDAYLRRWQDKTQQSGQSMIALQQQSLPVPAQGYISHNPGSHNQTQATVSISGTGTYSSPYIQQASPHTSQDIQQAHTGGYHQQSSAHGTGHPIGQGNQAPASIHPNATAMYNMYGGNPIGPHNSIQNNVLVQNSSPKTRNPRSGDKPKQRRTKKPAQSHNIEPPVTPNSRQVPRPAGSRKNQPAAAAPMPQQIPFPTIVNGKEMYDMDTVRLLLQRQHERTLASVQSSQKLCRCSTF